MPDLKVILVLVLSALSLGACSMIREQVGRSDSNDGKPVTMAKAGPQAHATSHTSPMHLSPEPPAGTDPNIGRTSRMSAAPGLQPVPRFGEPTNRDLVAMTDKLAGGAVEIYSFDKSVPGAPKQPQGMRSIVEPNVTVFPLADDGPYPGQAMPQMAWPNAVLPSYAGSEQMTPMPAPSVTSYAGSGGPARVYFRHGSASLDRDDRKVLKQVSEEAKFAPVSRVSVEGHASRRAGTGDPVKDQIVNLKESMNRAFEVSKTMMLNGVPGEKIKTTAWGDTKPPIMVQGSEEAESRRVEVYTGSGY